MSTSIDKIREQFRIMFFDKAEVRQIDEKKTLSHSDILTITCIIQNWGPALKELITTVVSSTVYCIHSEKEYIIPPNNTCFPWTPEENQMKEEELSSVISITDWLKGPEYEVIHNHLWNNPEFLDVSH